MELIAAQYRGRARVLQAKLFVLAIFFHSSLDTIPKFENFS